MNITPTGHITSAGLKTYEKRENLRQYFGLLKARIDEVLYTDNPKNNSYTLYGVKTVQYTCTIVGSQYDGCRITNVMDAVFLGGVNNYSESVRTALDQQGSSSKSGSISYEKTNGDFVLLMFLYGSLEHGIIVAGFPHPQKEGADEDTGKTNRGEYNGVRWEINSDGELTFVREGLKDAKGKPIDTKTSGQTYFLDKEGTTYLIGVDGSMLIMNPKEKEVKIIDQNGNILHMNDSQYAMIDKNGNSITMTDTGIKIIDVNSNTFELNDTGLSFVSSDKMNIMSKELALYGGTVLLGNNATASSDSVPLGDKLATMLNQAFALIMSHVHPGPGSPAPTLSVLSSPPYFQILPVVSGDAVGYLSSTVKVRSNT